MGWGGEGGPSSAAPYMSPSSPRDLGTWARRVSTGDPFGDAGSSKLRVSDLKDD